VWRQELVISEEDRLVISEETRVVNPLVGHVGEKSMRWYRYGTGWIPGVVGLGDSLVISEETSVVSFGGGLILPERDQCRGDWRRAGPLRRGQCREGGCRL
jgi:hypothetical protein